MSEDIDGDNLVYIVSDILFNLGLNNTLLGFDYLVNAIILLNKYNYCDMGEIENIIAKKFNTTIDCVEQCMRYCIGRYLRKSLTFTQEFFNYNTRNITASILVYKVHYYLHKTI